jgi:hypothetical protein
MSHAKPSIDQILDGLKREVVLGRAYLTIARGLAGADPVVLQTAQTFFGLTLEASLQVSQMFAAKLYDKTRGAVTVTSLLARCLLDASTFKNGTPAQVSQAVTTANARIAGLASILTSVQDRRNQAIAHLDPRTVANPTALAANAKLTLVDLEKLFGETGRIINDVSVLWHDTSAIIDLFGSEDYRSALDLIAEAKHAQADRWEAAYHEPCPFPRPRSRPPSWWEL